MAAPTIVQYPGVYFGYPNKGTHGRMGVVPVAIVHHTMEGWWSFYKEIVSGRAPGYENTATFSINVDGTIHQHTALTDAAWCNGLDWTKGGLTYHKSDPALTWLAEAYKARISPNCYTYSIELEGMSGTPLTDPQYKSLVALDKYLMEITPAITPNRIHLVGHYQIDGVNKQSCPGSKFPWTQLIKDLTPVAPPPPATGAYTADSTDSEGNAIGQDFADFLNKQGSDYPKPRLLVDSGTTGDKWLYLVGPKALMFRAWWKATYGSNYVREVWSS